MHPNGGSGAVSPLQLVVYALVLKSVICYNKCVPCLQPDPPAPKSTLESCGELGFWGKAKQKNGPLKFPSIKISKIRKILWSLKWGNSLNLVMYHNLATTAVGSVNPTPSTASVHLMLHNFRLLTPPVKYIKLFLLQTMCN